MKNFNYLMEMTKEFIDGKMNVISFMLDLPYELELRYQEMLKENFNMTKICQIVHSERLLWLAINSLKALRKMAFVSYLPVLPLCRELFPKFSRWAR